MHKGGFAIGCQFGMPEHTQVVRHGHIYINNINIQGMIR